MDLGSLRQLENDLECTICMETFVDARVLICQHVFCLDCLRGYAGDKKVIACPICREDTLLKQGEGAEFLPKPVVLNKVKETLSSLDLSSSASDAQVTSLEKMCSLCEEEPGSPVDYMCQQCLEYMCKLCFDKHLSIQGFKKHGRLTIGSFVKCAAHGNKVCKLWCSDCETPVCVKCLFTFHTGHCTEDIADAIQGKKELLANKLKHISENLKGEEGRLKMFLEHEKTAEDAYQQCTKAVLDWCAKVSNEIQDVTSEMISRLERENTKQRAMFEDQIKIRQNDVKLKTFIRDDIAKCLEEQNPNEILTLKVMEVPSEECKEQVVQLPSLTVNDPGFREQLLNLQFEPLLVKDAQTFASVVRSESATPTSKPKMTKSDASEHESFLSIGKWKVSDRNNFANSTRKFTDIVCDQEQKMIYCRVKDSRQLETILKVGPDLKCVGTIVGETFTDGGIAFDSKRNLVIVGSSPGTLKTYKRSLEYLTKTELPGISRINKMVYIETMDSLAASDNINNHIHIYDGSTYRKKLSFASANPDNMDFDLKTGLLAVSSRTDSVISLYDSTNSFFLKTTIQHSYLKCRSGITFMSSVLYGCNLPNDNTKTVMWAVPLTSAGKFKAHSLLKRSDISDDLSLISHIGMDQLIVYGNPTQLISIKRA